MYVSADALNRLTALPRLCLDVFPFFRVITFPTKGQGKNKVVNFGFSRTAALVKLGGCKMQLS
jgi:hypothetical protein